jgi:hypothetical protein
MMLAGELSFGGVRAVQARGFQMRRERTFQIGCHVALDANVEMDLGKEKDEQSRTTKGEVLRDNCQEESLASRGGELRD